MARSATAQSCSPSPLAPTASQNAVYQPRKPKESPLWRFVEQHLEEFLRVYDDRFAPSYGPLRASVRHGLEAFRKCGVLDWGFARVRCPECRQEYLLAFSCKRRCLCPSCHKKRQIEVPGITRRQRKPRPGRQSPRIRPSVPEAATPRMIRSSVTTASGEREANQKHFPGTRHSAVAAVRISRVGCGESRCEPNRSQKVIRKHASHLWAQ